MIWGLLRRIVTFGVPIAGPAAITVTIDDRWPAITGVEVETPTAAIAERWPRVDGVRVR